MTTDHRRTVGATGERIAADHLLRAGYKIIDRNFRTRFGELDIVVADAEALVFCEVKARLARSALTEPLESIHPRKCVQVRRIAGQWLALHPGRPRRAQIRFDAIGVLLDGHGRLLRLDHLEAAF